VNNDPAVKGIWCVPKYSNPTGITYSDAVVERFARLRPAARDFRIFWDNAYTVHGIYDKEDKLKNLFDLLKNNGKENMIFIFGSTSKISFAGAGLSAMGASRANIQLTQQQLTIQTIGYDKISELMHARFFGDINGIKAHMKKHAALLRPKFQMVDQILTQELGELGIATWSKPNGGYFISLDTIDNCAKRTIQLCDLAGVKLTGAGAAFPYGVDPRDRNIRIAPSYPDVEELQLATKLLCLGIKIATVEYYLTISI
ncbi:MAG: aminotransferase, partial [Angelakisella sp.]